VPTVTLPLIEGCIAQWYVIVPRPLNMTVYESPGINTPESNCPSSEVTVCGTLPSLTHVTVVPASTVTLAGEKKKSWMDTGVVAPCAVALGAITTMTTRASAAR
jgi:hypothetical protein